MIGSKLRKARQERGLSLQDLADGTNLTTSFLSQLERDLVNPSLETLRRICKALDFPMFLLFVDEEPRQILVRRDQRQRLAGESGGVFERLSPIHHQHKLELILLRLEPRGTNHPEPWTHPGEEVALCLRGAVEVHVADNVYRLEEGDCLYLDSTVPHQYRNPSAGEAHVLLAMTPPSY